MSQKFHQVTLMIFQKCKDLLKGFRDNLRALSYFEPENKFSQLVRPFIKLKASLLFITLLNIGKSYYIYNTERPIQNQYKNQTQSHNFTKSSLEQSTGDFSQSKAMSLVVLDSVTSNEKKIWSIFKYSKEVDGIRKVTCYTNEKRLFQNNLDFHHYWINSKKVYLEWVSKNTSLQMNTSSFLHAET